LISSLVSILPLLWQNEQMKLNIAVWDQVLRLFIGLLLFSWAIAGGPWWAYFGLYLLTTGAWRYCVLYSFFKFTTVREPSIRSIP
jgi:hypothetical protein